MTKSIHSKRFFYTFLYTIIALVAVVLVPSFASASTTSGTIDGVNKYAKGLDEDIGRINFGTANGNITITDSTITGYAWSEVFGWINLAPTNGGVTNNGEGTLSGYAFGENTGWINFKPTNGGVTINSGGDFLGYAWGENIGWILFNCATNSSCATDNFKVSTDWRPRSARPACNNATDDDGDGKTDYPSDIGCSSLTDTDETGPFGGGIIGGGAPPPSGTVSPVIPQDEEIKKGNNGIENDGEGEDATPNDEQTQDDENDETDSGKEEDANTVDEGNITDKILTDIEKDIASGDSIVSIVSKYGIAETVSVFAGGWLDKIAENATLVINGIKKISGYAGTAIIEARGIIQSPTGSIATKTVSAVGVVAGGAIVASSAFFQVSSLYEFYLLFARLWGLFLSALGISKRSRPWGTVYDSVTKQPIDPAQIILRNIKGEEITTAITDIDGRFGFFAEPGIYKLDVQKSNYAFPSKKIFGKERDEIYNSLYFGELFTVKSDGEVIIKNIPLDQTGFDWNQFAKKEKKLLVFYSRYDRFINKFSSFFFFIGFVVVIAVFFLNPQPYNILLMLLYVVLGLFHQKGVVSKKTGVIRDKATRTPLSFAIVKVLTADGTREVVKKTTDKF